MPTAKPSKILVSTTGGDVLGVATIDRDAHKATIDVDFKTPAGQQLLAFWEAYPDTIGISFIARQAIPKIQGEKTDGKN